AAALLGHHAEPVDFRKLCAFVGADLQVCPAPGQTWGSAPTKTLAGFDAVLVRTMPPGSLEQVVFRMDVLHRLEARGVAVLNPPKAVEICVDKYLATAKLE